MFARIRMCASNGAQRVIKHRFSTGVDGPPKSSVQKAMAFLKRNRQQLINMSVCKNTNHFESFIV